MANGKSPYFTLDGGLSYKSVLKHFHDQAHGKQKMYLIPNNRQSSRNPKSLVLLDLADNHPEQNNATNQPKIEVIDPAEAERKRALGQLERDTMDDLEGSVNATNSEKSIKNLHSMQGSRKSNTRKRKITQEAVRQKVKRVKDVFG